MEASELHLKYRPQLWDEVIGQEAVVRSVQQAVEAGTARSFLFCGPSGCGKTTLARLVAKAVGCADADLMEIDAATHTGVEAMRAVTKSVLYAPMHGDTKMVVVDECHRLSGNAWDSLLKHVEEPPPGVYWAFCTTEPTKVPKTICTRCLEYELGSVDRSDLMELVSYVAGEEEFGLPDNVLYLVARKAEGSRRRALTCLAKVVGCTELEEAALVLRTVLEDGEVIDLCRALMKKLTWAKAMKLMKPLWQMNPESVRLIILHYYAKVVRSDSDKTAGHALTILDAFSEPCRQSEGWAPFLLALGDCVWHDKE